MTPRARGRERRGRRSIRGSPRGCTGRRLGSIGPCDLARYTNRSSGLMAWKPTVGRSASERQALDERGSVSFSGRVTRAGDRAASGFGRALRTSRGSSPSGGRTARRSRARAPRPSARGSVRATRAACRRSPPRCPRDRGPSREERGGDAYRGQGRNERAERVIETSSRLPLAGHAVPVDEARPPLGCEGRVDARHVGRSARGTRRRGSGRRGTGIPRTRCGTRRTDTRRSAFERSVQSPREAPVGSAGGTRASEGCA